MLYVQIVYKSHLIVDAIIKMIVVRFQIKKLLNENHLLFVII